MTKFEDDLIIVDSKGQRFDNQEELLDYFATIFCDGISGDDRNIELVEIFLEENELGEIPKTAMEWLSILNTIGGDWDLL